MIHFFLWLDLKVDFGSRISPVCFEMWAWKLSEGSCKFGTRLLTFDKERPQSAVNSAEMWLCGTGVAVL